MKNWIDLGSDVNWLDYGGKWGKRDPNVAGVWWVVRFENIEEQCGTDAYGNGMRYLASVQRVDIGSVSTEEFRAALDSSGLDLTEIDEEYREIAIVETLSSYGTYAPMGEHWSNYGDRARASARRDALEMMADDSACNAELDRPVNKIGSTARDFQAGDVLAGLRRYAEDGLHGTSATHDLMFRLYGGVIPS